MKFIYMKPSQGGFTLIEALVAMVLLSVVMMGLAPVLLGAVAQQRTDVIRLERTGVMVAQTNRMLAIPYAQLASETFTVGEPYSHDYEIEINVSESGNQALIKVKVTPAAPQPGPDSVQFSRVRP